MKKIILCLTLISCTIAPTQKAHAWNSQNTWALAKIVLGLGAATGGALGIKYCYGEHTTYKEKLQKFVDLAEQLAVLENKPSLTQQETALLRQTKSALSQIEDTFVKQPADPTRVKNAIALRKNLWSIGILGGAVVALVGGATCLWGTLQGAVQLYRYLRTGSSIPEQEEQEDGDGADDDPLLEIRDLDFQDEDEEIQDEEVVDFEEPEEQNELPQIQDPNPRPQPPRRRPQEQNQQPQIDNPVVNPIPPVQNHQQPQIVIPAPPARNPQNAGNPVPPAREPVLEEEPAQQNNDLVTADEYLNTVLERMREPIEIQIDAHRQLVRITQAGRNHYRDNFGPVRNRWNNMRSLHNHEALEDNVNNLVRARATAFPQYRDIINQ